jgi:hypothetical protein
MVHLSARIRLLLSNEGNIMYSVKNTPVVFGSAVPGVPKEVKQAQEKILKILKAAGVDTSGISFQRRTANPLRSYMVVGGGREGLGPLINEVLQRAGFSRKTEDLGQKTPQIVYSNGNVSFVVVHE